MSNQKHKIAIFASGNGSNFENIVKQQAKFDYEVAFLFCDRKQAYVIERAKKLNIPYFYFSIIKEREQFDVKIIKILQIHKIELVVLAGYMKLINPAIIKKFENRIVNIHPSLLPKYPGKNAIKQAFENNESKYGITIHFVDEGMDTGKIIESHFFISKSKKLTKITTRIHKLEHIHYPKVINQVVKERCENRYRD